MLELSKALSERTKLVRLLSSLEGDIREAFGEFLKAVTTPRRMREVRELLEAGQIDRAVELADDTVFSLSNVLQEVFQEVVQGEIRRYGQQLAGNFPDDRWLNVAFDLTDPRAVEFMRTNRLRFVNQITTDQRRAIRTALFDGIAHNQGPAELARSFRSAIGLTSYQLGTVQNYRRLLETGSRAALDRALRDRRYDRAVEAVLDGTRTFSSNQIDTMVERYRARLLNLRAQTIARTEAQLVMNEGRQLAWQQMVDIAGFNIDRIRRVWNATHDKRVRDTHAAMDGQERRLNEPFDSPSGAQLMYPGDRSAPASETINCRCVLTLSIGRP